MKPIAIVGIGCRFPGADGPDEFWRLVHDGVDAITEVPPDRWPVDDLYDADPAAPGKMITRWGGFLSGVDRFDHEFFGISPREASAIDPQQRLLLEVTWEALEDAGQVPAALAGSDTAVFVGVSTYDYALLQAGGHTGIDAYWGTGVALSVAANRISYTFDLRGPSLVVDTACSSSLVAVHQACQSLWRGESGLALAGGVNLVLSPSFGINFTKAGVMAPDGRCKTFDARADGYVRGEGAGVLVLKPLARALADHDPIRAVVRGGAVAQDGRTNGLMAPNRLSQQDLLRAAYRHAGVEPGDVGYVEAHGTGTLLGDRMEAQALGTVVGEGRPPERPCVVGSVKSNIGHLEAAAGVAGLIKAALVLEHREIPASLHVENPNPDVDFDALRLRVARTRTPWERRQSPARAGVSSFGFGGTIAHLVLEEAPPVRPPVAPQDGPVLLAVSGRTPDALRQAARRHLDLLTGDGPALGDLAHTAGARRTHHRHRLAVVAGTRDEAANQVRAFLAGAPHAGITSGDAGPRRRSRVVFVCPGQGPVWWPLDPALRDEPALRASLAECDRLVLAEAGWSVVDRLWADGDTSRLGETDFCQPALFALQVALADLWRSLGITPDAVVGHSMGEVAAAYLSGALNLADAVRVVCHRGRVIRTVSGRGRMAVVDLPADAVHDVLRDHGDRVSVAAVNAPSSTVISGDPAAVDEITARWRDGGIFCRVLGSVDFASHSPQMAPLQDDLAAALRDLSPTAARLPMYSTVTGEPVDGSGLDGAYWAANIRQPVRFADAVGGLLDDGHDVFVELSPHPALLPAIAQNARARRADAVLVPTLRRDEPPRAVTVASLGALHTAGVDPDWAAVFPGPRRPVRLPPYPWQRERAWVTTSDTPAPTAGGHPLLGRHLRLAGAGQDHVWETTLTAADLFDDHRVTGVAVLPGAAWLEMASAAAAQAFGRKVVALTAVQLRRMLALDDPATVQVRLSTTNGPDATFHAYARTGGPEWTEHATGTVVAETPQLPVLDLEAVRARCRTAMPAADLYRAMSARGVGYGPRFRAVEQLWVGEREAVARLAVPSADGYGVHPVLVDGGLQVLAAALGNEADDRRPLVPVGIDGAVVRPGTPRRLWAHAVVRSGAVGDVRLTDDDGHTVALLEGVHVTRLGDDTWLPASVSLHRARHEMSWQHRERATTGSARPGGWLVLADGHGVAAALAAHLSEPTVLAAPGDDLHRVVAAARERWGGLRGVVHLGSLDTPDETGDLQAAHERGVVSALRLVKVLADGPPTRLWFVTRGATDGTSVAQAPLWGLGRVAALEHPGLRPTLVDLDPAEDSTAWLAAELRADDAETQVAVRGGERHVARLVRPVSPRLEPADVVCADATYLVTGGLGALGLLVARLLVDRGARHLVLVGRRGPGGAGERALAALRRAGAEIQVARADVRDEQALARVLADAATSLPPVRGVVHAAGVLDDATLRTLDDERLLAVLEPKVAGAWHLHRLTEDLPLDFFVLFSSLAATLGSPGQGNYAAANAFLDALAVRRAAQGRPALSIAWGPWRDTGLAVRPDGVGRFVEQAGVGAIPPATGVEWLGRLLGLTTPWTAVAPVDWDRWAAASPDSPLTAELAAAAPEAHEGLTVDELFAADPADRHALLESYLHVAIARALDMAPERLNPDQPLTGAGLDSLVAVGMKNRIEVDLGMSLPLTAALEGASLRQLAAQMLDDATTAAPRTASGDREDEAWEEFEVL